MSPYLYRKCHEAQQMPIFKLFPRLYLLAAGCGIALALIGHAVL
jgi:hypothetical protein